MNLCGVTQPLRLEQLARRLAGKRSNEGAQRLVTLRVEVVVRVRASVRSMSSPPLTPMPSSFGHDTLPMLNVDAGFACPFCCDWAALSAAPDASATDRRIAVAA